MASKTIRRALVAVVLLALAGLILPPFVNVGRYKARVVQSMSQALGRPVSCGSLELRLLPQPGFYLDNVTIGDDPAYSAEPVLYADSVTAYLSIRSLWRGRMEFSRLALDYPSLNLVEGAHGGWNLESLLWKASQTRTSPTGAGQSAARPRFPYVEASNGRINFKNGLDKSVFSFVNASFSLWSPAEDEWRMRLEARPVRTDMPVTDTGVVRASLTVQRAPRLRDAPIQATLSWENVQMGNLTRLLSAKDRGWRGAMEARARLSGTAQALHFSTAATFHDLRRYDVIGGEAPALKATCEGVLNLTNKTAEHGECRLPLDGGVVAVQGSASGLHAPRYDLTLTAEDLGAGTLLNLARRAKHNLPDDLTATGTISASFEASCLGDAPPLWIGNLEVNSLNLHSAELGKDLGVAKITAEVNTSPPSGDRERRGAPPPQRALQIERFRLPLGGAAPATVNGSLDGRHFTLRLQGSAAVERLQEVARSLGIGAPKLSLRGAAAVDLTLAGAWGVPDELQLSGTATVKNVHAQVPGLAAPVEISAARLGFDRDRFTLTKASASIGRDVFSGTASFPRSCDTDAPCQSSFDLTTGELNLARWNQLLNPHLKKRPWYYFGSGGSTGNAMASLNASGTLRARRLTIETMDGKTVSGSNFETSFTVANGVLSWPDARANLFGGTVRGDWSMDWTRGEPRYEGSGTAVDVDAAKLAPLLGSAPGSGLLSVQYKIGMSGEDADSLNSSSSAEVEFRWSGGSLRLSPDGRGPLRVRGGEGTATLDKDGWTIAESQWRTGNQIYQLSGTISRSSALDLVFATEDGSSDRIQGTLNKPRRVLPSATPRRRLR